MSESIAKIGIYYLNQNNTPLFFDSLLFSVIFFDQIIIF